MAKAAKAANLAEKMNIVIDSLENVLQKVKEREWLKEMSLSGQVKGEGYCTRAVAVESDGRAVRSGCGRVQEWCKVRSVRTDGLLRPALQAIRGSGPRRMPDWECDTRPSLPAKSKLCARSDRCLKHADYRFEPRPAVGDHGVI